MAKPGKIVKKITAANGEFRGYQFQDDEFANQLAYLFASDEGEEKAKAVFEEAQKKFPHPLAGQLDINFESRKKFIEAEVKKIAVDRDEKLHNSLKGILDLIIKNKTGPCSGVCKEEIYNLFQSLGIDVDKDNLQTHFNPGPPQILTITFVLRPTENLKNDNSEINKLADYYKNNCCPNEEQKKNFGDAWDKHRENAKIGGPKIEKDKFLADANQTIKASLNELKQPEQQNEKDMDERAGMGMQNK